MKRKLQIWVAPEFKKMIKSEAAKNNCNILEYTRKVAKNKGGKLKEIEINSFWSKLI